MSEKEVIELIHFIRTPLASIKIGGDILNDFMPILINFYKNNSTGNNLQINQDKLNKLECVISNILTETNRISDYINGMKFNNLSSSI